MIDVIEETVRGICSANNYLDDSLDIYVDPKVPSSKATKTNFARKFKKGRVGLVVSITRDPKVKAWLLEAGWLHKGTADADFFHRSF